MGDYNATGPQAMNQVRPPRYDHDRPPRAVAARGVAVVDKDGIFISVNGAASQMLGMPLRELVGKSLLDFLSEVTFEEGDDLGGQAVDETPSQAIMRLCGGAQATLRSPDPLARPRVVIAAEPTFNLASAEMETVVVTLTRVEPSGGDAPALSLDKRILADVMANAGSALLMVDPDGIVSYANALATEWFGDNGELTGRFCGDVLGLEDSEEYCISSEALRAGKVVRGAAFEKLIHGEDRLLQPMAMRVRSEDGRIRQVAVVITDVTEQRRAERWLRNALSELRQRNAETSGLLRSARSALQERDFRQTVKYLFADCKRLVRAEAGYVMRCDDSPTVTETLLQDTGGLRHVATLPLPMPVRGLMAEVYRTREAAYQNRLSRSKWAAVAASWPIPIENVLYAPLVVGGNVFGFLGLADKPGGFDESDLHLTSAFAELMAVALRNSDTVALLERNEERLRWLAENAPDIIFRYDLRPTRGFTFVSPIVEGMLGYSPEEFYLDPDMGRKITHPDDLPLLEAQLAANDARPLLCRWRHKDGKWVWTEQHRAHIYDDSGELAAIEGIVRDVTEKKGAEDALRESEERYRSVIAALEEGIILWNRDGSAVECNASAERIMGVPRDKICGRETLAWNAYYEDGSPFPSDQHPAILTLRTGSACSNVVMGLIRPQAGLVWLTVNSQPLFKEGEALPFGVVTSFSDITHRKQAEEQMSLLARHVRLLLESTDVGIFGIDLLGRCTFLNSFGAGLLGYEPDDVLGRDIHALVHQTEGGEQERQHGDCTFLQVLQTGNGIRAANQLFRRADGSTFSVDYSCYPIIDEGTITGAVVTFNDITQRTETEQAWRESQAELAEAQRLAHLGSYRWDTRRGDVTFSEEASNIFEVGQSGVPISAGQCLEAIHPDDRQIVSEATGRAANEGKGYSLECRILLPDGRLKHVQMLGKPETDSTGKAARITGTVMDITERKLLEERLLRAQRLETAGRIAGQVAHDFNNLLAPLALYPDLMRMQLPDGHPVLKYCDGMLEVVQQMADINGDLLSLGRRGHFEQQVVDVNRIVRQATEGLIEKPDSLELVTDLSAEMSYVKGSSAQLLRAVTNLIVNAREAMHDVGTLTVKTDNVYVDEPFGHYDQVEVGEYVRLTVSDTGHGIPPNIRDKVFDAFFTTKLADKKPGTGLGLSIVLAVVEDHAGYLDLESRDAEGTTFFVYLPACREKPEQPVRSLNPRGGAETILVVDDDRALREAVSELLGQLGYHVETVPSGEAATVYVNQQPVDLMILDMIMPLGIDGTETLRRVLEFRPDQKAIVLSGFAESDRVKEALRLGAGAFLRKPISMDKLAVAVREELDRV